MAAFQPFIQIESTQSDRDSQPGFLIEIIFKDSQG